MKEAIIKEVRNIAPLFCLLSLEYHFGISPICIKEAVEFTKAIHEKNLEAIGIAVTDLKKRAIYQIAARHTYEPVRFVCNSLLVHDIVEKGNRLFPLNKYEKQANFRAEHARRQMTRQSKWTRSGTEAPLL
ncbi:MAG: hypothetical protein ACI9YB_002979 [Halioglobus sp.]|jgi:hypothetical protein